MAKKKFRLSLSYDAPVSLSFALLSVLLFALDTLVFKGKLPLFAPTSPGGELPFALSSPLSYLRIILHVFGATGWQVLVSNLIFILLLGPVLEEYYGSMVLALMMGLCSLLSGVLNVCFCRLPSSGADSILFMLILLNAFISINKKKLPLASVAVLVLFICGAFIGGSPNGVVGIIISFAGGICGSLLAMLTSPKVRAVKKTAAPAAKSTGGLRNRAQQYQPSDDDSTVVGTLKF